MYKGGSSMRFGFDIDDTLIDLRRHAFYLYEEKLGRKASIEAFEQLKTVAIHSLFDLTNEEGKKMWQDTMEDIYFTNCPSFDMAKEVVNGLVAAGHEVFYVTARPKHYCEKTREWMKAQGFPVVDAKFFCGMEDHEKIDTIRNLHLDYYIDDKPAVLDTLVGIDTMLLIKDQSYNQEATRYPRLYQWNEFKDLVK